MITTGYLNGSNMETDLIMNNEPSPEYIQERIKINREQFVENITHKEVWMRLSVPASSLTHIIMESDRVWLEDNYPEIVFLYLGEHYLKHIPQEIDWNDDW